MTPEDVERLAMALPGTTRDPHWGQMGFHHQRTFAIIHDDKTLYLRLSIADRASLLAEAPDTFAKYTGRGPDGLTIVALDRIDEQTLRSALAKAWRNGETPRPQTENDQNLA